MDHAVLAPSSSGRWLICTPSARLEQRFENVESDAAMEGTLAHSIAECLLRNYEKFGTIGITIGELPEFKKNRFYTESLFEYAVDFANYVLEQKGAKDLLFVEIELDLTTWIPESFGHSDAAVLQIKKKHLHVNDLKFGKGVPVYADDNKQLKIYALGVLSWLEFYGYDYPVETITLHIYQPRIPNNSTFTLTKEELLYWAANTLKPNAEAAFKGEGNLIAGHHCKFCNAAGQCRALAEYSIQLAKTDFNDLMLLEDFEVMEVFEKLPVFELWVKAVKEFTLREALKGRAWPGFKLVEGKSNRRYKDETVIEKLLLEKLYISNMHKPKELLGVSAMEDLLGKEKFNTYIVPHLIKPKGAPTLAPESDSRPVFNSAESDFKTDYVDEEDFMN